MSMNTYVIGIRPPDEKFRKMLDAYKACSDAGIEPPDEVLDFFEGETPDPKGVHLEITSAESKWAEDAAEGIEVDLSKLPKDVSIIRFVNSW